MSIESNELVANDIESRRAFLFTLEWLLALHERYSCPLHFGLVHIKLGDNHELAETVGINEAFKQLTALTMSLAATFRKTDLVARDFTDFWVIVPYTKDAEKINNKILNIFQEAESHGLNAVDREVSVFELPLISTQTQKRPTNALEFLGYLKENKQALASHTFRLSAMSNIQNQAI
jgi:hypothetical protein